MRKTLLFGALLTALPAAATTQPDFFPLAGGKNAATAKNGPVMRSPLAQTIAARIAQWIEGGEVVFDKQTKTLRPMTAGDIMVLVRRRNLLAEEIIRQLKRRSIPVAGADRLKLAEHIAVMDLIA